MNETLKTSTAGYETLVVSAAGGETDLDTAPTTAFVIGVPAPGTADLNPKDLSDQDGSSIANGVELISYAKGIADATYTVALYGVSIDGPPERIASLAYTLGDAVVSSGVLWAGTCVATDTHNALITVADSGNDRVAKVTFDAIGYRYLYAIAHTSSGSTLINVLYRPY